eukprot:scaffold383111_cov23-Prasinocladus_malaysianus.AAC.1
MHFQKVSAACDETEALLSGTPPQYCMDNSRANACIMLLLPDALINCAHLTNATFRKSNLCKWVSAIDVESTCWPHDICI